jgi:putative CocE/NonD family hydrolase
MKLRTVFAAALLLVAAPAAVAQAPAPATAAAESPFNFREVMIPVRDGVTLQTVILTPRNQTGSLPILFQRTPYGLAAGAPPTMPRSWAALAKDGYIFVFQSMRGRFKSGGTFTLSTAVHPNDPKATDEATDAYDSIDWLLKNVPNNNGKVGMWGISYPGFAAAVALVKPHPALKAVSPQAAWIDYWQNDDLHRNGALRLSYATDWLYMLQHDKEDSDFEYGQYDTYDWFLKMGPVANIDAQRFKGGIPMFTSLLDHPNHDAFYTSQRWSEALGRTTVPTLNVAGYWDQEDPWGSWQIWRKQAQNDPDHLTSMVAGPWPHGWWSRAGTTALGRVPYGVDASAQFLEDVQAPFFRYWLHGKGEKPDTGVKSFQSGSWTWKHYAAWPPAGAKPTDLYLLADGTLSFTPPGAAGAGCRTYVSDPANPVPFRPRPISATYPRPEWTWWEAEDQRFVDHRPDVLSWLSAPLTRDVTITGPVEARLFAGTTGTDSDLVVKLIDVLPDDYEKAPENPKLGDYTRSLNGYELPIAMEVKRGRFLASETDPRPLTPGQVVAWNFGLRDHDHVFKAGHRIMVQVQSSWFPVIDRNPQTFAPNIARAKPTDFVMATQTVCSTAAQPSHLVLPVAE